MASMDPVRVLILPLPVYAELLTESNAYLMGRLQPYRERCDFYFPQGDALTDEELAGADVIMGNPEPRRLKQATNLRWLQLQSAGVNGYNRRERYARDDVKVSRLIGVFGPVIAEYVVGAMIALSREWPYYTRRQMEKVWRPVPRRQTELRDSTVCLLGTGDLSGEIVRLLKPFNCRIVGLRRRFSRTAEGYDAVFSWQERAQALGAADFVVNTLPYTPETKDAVDEDTFASMKRGSYYVAVGRGKTTSTKALELALDEGQIAGCCLDVTEPEPLPPESGLWLRENVLITPHASVLSAGTDRRRVERLTENLGLWLSGRELPGLLDFERGY